MKTLLFLSIITVLLITFAVAYAIHELIPAETMVPLPGAYGKAVYKYITKEDSYKRWGYWPGKGKLYKGKHPHGAYLTTYINNNARFSIKAGKPMANGSFIVMKNYTQEKKFAEITVMYKIKGYSPAQGDWFWAQYDKGGNVLKEGKVKGCIECHSAKKANDYIFTSEFVKQ